MSRFDELHTFVAVVEAASFSAAAERLGLAKSAVSRRISELEGRLGAQLLNRTTRRISLTDAGREFYERAQRLLSDLEEAEQSVIAGQAALRGRLRLAAPLSFGLLHLAPALDAFLAEHPELVLDLDLDDRRINLVEEGFDLALRIGELADSSLVARALAPIRMQLCASAEYVQRHGLPRQPSDLAAHAGLVYGNVPEAQQWRFIESGGKSHVVKVPARLRANNGDVLLRATLDGLGICVIPTFLCAEALARGDLIALLPGYEAPGTQAYLVYPSRRHLPQRVRALVEFLVQRFGMAPYWDQRLAEALR